jgi:hypothetical protein
MKLNCKPKGEGAVSAMCKCEGCERRAEIVSAGMCRRHARNVRLYGTPEAPARRTTPQAELAQAALERGLAEAVEVGECLEWQSYFMCKGATPAVKARNAAKGNSENIPACRLIWERDHGPIPAGKLIYRTCCNCACVRHLACGTRKDWARARKKAGTTAHSTIAKLHLTLAARRRSDVTNTMEKAREVRSLAAARVKTDEISRLTGVHPTMVAEIRQGNSWRELGASPFAGLCA